MSNVRSWGMIHDPRRLPLRPRTARRPERQDAPLAYQVPPEPFTGARSTGYFETPDEEGAALDLGIFLSSFAQESRPVVVQVNRLVEGSPEVIFVRRLQLPPGEGRRLEVSDVVGEQLEVRVDAAADVIPSAAVTQFFIADGGILVRVYKSPADFVQV